MIENKLQSPIKAIVEANYLDFAVGRAGMTYKNNHYMALLDSNIVVFIKIMSQERSDAEVAAYKTALHLGIALVPPSIRLDSISPEIKNIVPKNFHQYHGSSNTCLVQYFVNGRTKDDNTEKHIDPSQQSESVLLRALLGHGDIHSGNTLIAFEIEQDKNIK